MMKTNKQSTANFCSIAMQKYPILLMFVSLMAGATSAWAQEKSSNQWDYDFLAYLWGSSLKGKTVTGDDISVDFSTIIKNLDFAVMGKFGARKNKLSIVSDVLYMKLGDTIKTDGDVLGRPVSSELDLGLSSWVINFGAGYALIDDGKNQFDLIVGVRYLDVSLDLDFNLNDRNTSIKENGHLWDGIIGARGKRTVSDKWYLNYYADIGGGDSKMTWQAVVGAGYKFKKMDGVFGYRYLRWNFDKDAVVFDSLNFQGPYAGLMWAF